MKKSFLNYGIALGTTLLFVSTVSAQSPDRTSQRRQSSKKEQTEIDIKNEGTNGQYQINYKDGAETYKIKMTGDNITELYVDDKLIPKEDYIKYDEKIKKIRAQIKKDKEMAEQDMKQATKDQHQAKLDQEQAAMQKSQAENDARQANQHKTQAENDRQRASADMKRSEKDRVRSQEDAVRASADAKHAEEDKQLVDDLLADLVKENIIDDAKNVSSIILNNETFTVNGKKQSEALHNRFKAVYLKKKGTKINFSSRTFSISDDTKEK